MPDVTAGSVEELEHELRVCASDVVAHHCAHSDFPRWIDEVLGDSPLAAADADVEAAVRAGTDNIALARTSCSRPPTSAIAADPIV